MANTMSRDDLVASLKASLHDAARVFVLEGAAPDAAFERFLLQALPDMQIKRPVTRLGSVALTANFARVAVGAGNTGFAAFKTFLWGEGCAIKPWASAYPGTLPRVGAVFADQQWWLAFDPAPTALQINAHGSQFDFWYYASHAIGAAEADTTLNPQDRGLLVLRAQVEAMRELAIRNAAKPVQLRDGLSGTPRNSTPAALADSLMRTFVEAR
jgi:hypothetical protein